MPKKRFLKGYVTGRVEPTQVVELIDYHEEMIIVTLTHGSWVVYSHDRYFFGWK